MENHEVKKKNEQEYSSPMSWHCDTYCRKVRYVTCEGKEHIDSNSPVLCPYFEEMLY